MERKTHGKNMAKRIIKQFLIFLKRTDSSFPAVKQNVNV